MSASSARGVLVTGASRGIGRACVQDLAGRGLHVLAGVRRTEDADALARSTRGTVSPVLIDVTDGAQVEESAERARELLGEASLVGLVNCAGTMASGPLEHVPLEAVRRQLEVNLIGPLAVVQAFLPDLRRSQGRIVNLGSTSGRIAGRFVGPYAASKAGLDSLTSVLRAELAEARISVSVIEPGVVATALWDEELAAQDAWLSALSAEESEHYGEAARRRREKLSKLRAQGLDPRVVAGVVTRALLSPRPKPRYVVGRKARMLVAVERALPERLVIRLTS